MDETGVAAALQAGWSVVWGAGGWRVDRPGGGRVASGTSGSGADANRLAALIALSDDVSCAVWLGALSDPHTRFRERDTAIDTGTGVIGTIAGFSMGPDGPLADLRAGDADTPLSLHVPVRDLAPPPADGQWDAQFSMQNGILRAIIGALDGNAALHAAEMLAAAYPQLGRVTLLTPIEPATAPRPGI